MSLVRRHKQSLLIFNILLFM